MDGFSINVTQMLGMIIPRANSPFRVLGSRSRSLWLFLESNLFLLMDFNTLNTNVGYDNISSNFQGPGYAQLSALTISTLRKNC